MFSWRDLLTRPPGPRNLGVRRGCVRKWRTTSELNRPHPDPLPRERELTWSRCKRSAGVEDPDASYPQDATKWWPSPGGEGWGEGGQFPFGACFVRRFLRTAHQRRTIGSSGRRSACFPEVSPSTPISRL